MKTKTYYAYYTSNGKRIIVAKYPVVVEGTDFNAYNRAEDIAARKAYAKLRDIAQMLYDDGWMYSSCDKRWHKGRKSCTVDYKCAMMEN